MSSSDDIVVYVEDKSKGDILVWVVDEEEGNEGGRCMKEWKSSKDVYVHEDRTTL